MSDQEWTPMIGLGRAAVSLVWRTVVAAGLWVLALAGFHAALDGIGVTSVPTLIAGGFGALCGTITGGLIARGLEERAGFVSPILTVMAAAGAAVAIVGGEALFARWLGGATDHLRFFIVGTTMIVTLAWVARYTLFDA